MLNLDAKKSVYIFQAVHRNSHKDGIWRYQWKNYTIIHTGEHAEYPAKNAINFDVEKVDAVVFFPGKFHNLLTQEFLRAIRQPF